MKWLCPICGLSLDAFAVVLAYLKLAGTIGWPWWLVTMPVWGQLVACVAVAGLLQVLLGPRGALEAVGLDPDEILGHED